MILAVMNAFYAVAYIEAWKIQDFNGVSTRDLAIPVRRSNQLSYEATDVGSWSSVGSNETMKNECELIYEIFQRRKQGNWKKMTAGLEGTFVKNPMWLQSLGRIVVTGHPLGGCAMGKTGRTGVVHHAWQVFYGTVFF